MSKQVYSGFSTLTCWPWGIGDSSTITWAQLFVSSLCDWVALLIQAIAYIIHDEECSVCLLSQPFLSLSLFLAISRSPLSVFSLISLSPLCYETIKCMETFISTKRGWIRFVMSDKSFVRNISTLFKYPLFKQKFPCILRRVPYTPLHLTIWRHCHDNIRHCICLLLYFHVNLYEACVFLSMPLFLCPLRLFQL